MLIKRQACQEISGYHSPQLGKNYMFPKTPSPFIQILHVKRNHWVVASSVNCEPGIVNIYDSLFSNIDLDTACQVASLVRHNKNNIHLQSINIQRQPNSRDCGLFAVAVAVELAQRRDPRFCYWDVSQIRSHLIQLLEINKITSFPLAKA